MTEGFGSAGHDRQGESVYRGGFLYAGISGYFRTIESGEKIFYPQGAFGRRGFAVASAEQELILRTNIRGFQRLYSGILIALILIFSGYLSTQTSWPVLLIVIGSWPVLWLLARAYFWRFTRTMEPSDAANWTDNLRLRAERSVPLQSLSESRSHLVAAWPDHRDVSCSLRDCIAELAADVDVYKI